MLKSLHLKLFFTLFIICSFLYASAIEHGVSVADMPREEIALLFQRLASGNVATTTREFRFGQRNIENVLGDRRLSEEGKSSKRRKIIVRPLVNAVLHGSASSALPNNRISITSTTPTIPPSRTNKTTTIEAKNNEKLKNTKSQEKERKTTTLGEMSWIIFIVIIGLFFSLATTIGNALVMVIKYKNNF
uniref:Uncharacterized protein n=1 Tax=Meloidogyne hapla TaxID=6305 RepID=A0A1I8BS16_MELHA